MINIPLYEGKRKNILVIMQEGFNNIKYTPCPMLVNMVAAGKLGIKTGEGFYKY